MRKNSFTIITFLLSVLFVIAVFPSLKINADIVDSGKCGADGYDLTWELDVEGVLTISGTGPMKNWEYIVGDTSPWFKNTDIKEVRIKEGVTTIGNNAFILCTNLEKVTIPKGVTSIGICAFQQCEKLKEVYIPDGVTTIYNDAFCDCTGLKDVFFPDSVTSICSLAFDHCQNLKKLKLPDNAQLNVGIDAFRCYGLGYIVYNPKATYSQDFFDRFSPYLYSYYDVVYVNKGHGTVTGKNRSYKKDELELEITPEEGYYVDTVFLIDSNENRTPVEPDNNGKYLCKIMPDSKDKVTIEATFIPGGSCGENVTWKLDSEGTLTISGTGAMEDRDVLSNPFLSWYDVSEDIKQVVIEDGVTNIGMSAFYYCTNLEKVTIPDSVTSIGENAFNHCESLKEIPVSENVTWIGPSAFCYCSGLTEVTIPNGITSIGVSTFSECTGLKNVTIPDSVTSIGSYAFYGCTGLKDITVPDSVTSIGKYAFRSCENLERIVFPDNKDLVVGEEVLAEDFNLKHVIINKEAKYDDNAFYFCSEDVLYYFYDVCYLSEGSGTVTGKTRSYIGDVLELEITPSRNHIVDKVTFIGSDNIEKPIDPKDNGKYLFEMPDSEVPVTFKATFVPGGSCGEGLTWVLDDEGVLTISGTGKMDDWRVATDSYPPWYEERSNIKKVIIKDGVTTIGNQAFVYCKNLEEITIPDSVTSIGKHSFFYCESLENLSIPDSVSLIGEGAFAYCIDLSYLRFPDNKDLICQVLIVGDCPNLSCIVLIDDIYPLTAFIDISDDVIYYFYDVNYVSEGNGMISGKTRTNINDVINLSVEPEDGYMIDKVTIIDHDNKEVAILPDENGNYSYKMPGVGPVTFKAYFKLFPKNVIFCISDDGKTTVLQEGPCDVGANPVYKGNVPTKEPTDQYTYTFIGWTDGKEFYEKDKELPAVSDTVTYTAVFEPTTNSYEITFLDEDGTELQSCKYEYGTTPSFNGTPTKSADDKFTYTFAGWTPELTKVTEDATYTAKFDANEKVIPPTPTPDPTPIVTPEPTPNPEVVASFEAFVERLYEVALGRESDPDGKAYWANQVVKGNLTGADCIKQFLLSEEFNNRNLSDEEFVTVLYKALFDRDAKDDPDGFNFWMDSLKTVGRESVVDGFINSTEWCNVCAAYGVKSGATKAKATVASKNATEFATRLYTECLEREPDEDGLKFWSLALTNLDITGTEAAHEFFYSAEFNSFNLSNTELVTKMYKTLLGREADSEGLAFWVKNMDNGMTKDQLFNSFADSPEFNGICVNYAIDR
ncbi:MAG: leucine-rich repeat protein [Clostridia bacterium]|nr:leucine-rich repeat protein [Clostridia bacterium]